MFPKSSRHKIQSFYLYADMNVLLCTESTKIPTNWCSSLSVKDGTVRLLNWPQPAIQIVYPLPCFRACAVVRQLPLVPLGGRRGPRGWSALERRMDDGGHCIWFYPRVRNIKNRLFLMVCVFARARIIMHMPVDQVAHNLARRRRAMVRVL